MVINAIIILILAALAGYLGNKIPDANKSKVSFMEAYDLTGLPIVTFKQGKTKFNCLLDTGATKSVIVPTMLDILKYADNNNTGTIFGMEGNIIDTKYVNIDFKHKNKEYTEEFQVVDMSNAFEALKNDTGVTIHGIIGGSFFAKYGYVIDYKDFVAYSK